MTLAICSCGIALVTNRGTNFCRHCDAVCMIKSNNCVYCRRLRVSNKGDAS